MDRDKLLKKIDSFKDELIYLRRHIHAHPELSGLENQTAILISGYLKNIGWRVTESVGRTGIVAEFGPKSATTPVVPIDSVTLAPRFFK